MRVSTQGKLTTPILLGVEIAEADPDDDEVEIEDENGEVETFKIPAYPEPYFRGLTGVSTSAHHEIPNQPPRLYTNETCM